jgi:hypothetical protein
MGGCLKTSRTAATSKGARQIGLGKKRCRPEIMSFYFDGARKHAVVAAQSKSMTTF